MWHAMFSQHFAGSQCMISSSEQSPAQDRLRPRSPAIVIFRKRHMATPHPYPVSFFPIRAPDLIPLRRPPRGIVTQSRHVLHACAAFSSNLISFLHHLEDFRLAELCKAR